MQQELPAHSSNDLQRELDTQQQELMTLTRRIADIKSDRIRDEGYFKE